MARSTSEATTRSRAAAAAKKSADPFAKDASTLEVEGVIKSAKRVMELLEFFAEQRRPLSVSDFVRGLDYPQSSTSVLLKSLVRLGYLDYDRRERLYMPTLRIALLGGWVHDQLFTDVSLSRMVDRLHAASHGATVFLGIQNEIYVQYIHVVQAPVPAVPWYVKPGSLRPLARTALGKMLLSRKPDVEVLYMLRRINAEETDPAHYVHGSELLKELDVIRQCGYASTEGNVNPGGGVVAIEMPTPASQPPMAIGIGSAIEVVRAERQNWVNLMREATLPYGRRPK